MRDHVTRQEPRQSNSQEICAERETEVFQGLNLSNFLPYPIFFPPVYIHRSCRCLYRHPIICLNVLFLLTLDIFCRVHLLIAVNMAPSIPTPILLLVLSSALTAGQISLLPELFPNLPIRRRFFAFAGVVSSIFAFYNLFIYPPFFSPFRKFPGPKVTISDSYQYFKYLCV